MLGLLHYITSINGEICDIPYKDNIKFVDELSSILSVNCLQNVCRGTVLSVNCLDSARFIGQQY